jgi:hypothetical protein
MDEAVVPTPEQREVFADWADRFDPVAAPRMVALFGGEQLADALAQHLAAEKQRNALAASRYFGRLV